MLVLAAVSPGQVVSALLAEGRAGQGRSRAEHGLMFMKS